MHKEKRKIIGCKWFMIIGNLAAIITLVYFKYISLVSIRFINSYGIVFYVCLTTFFIKLMTDRRIKKLYLNCNIRDVDEMTGMEFEYFLYYKFKKLGYRVKTTPITGDYGADLILRSRGEKTVIQAKRYQNNVGITAVQEVIGSIAYYGAHRAIVVTNSYFTPNAINLANANDIELWDRKVLLRELMGDKRGYGEKKVDICPKCSEKLVYRKGKYGYFLGCSAYPKCNYTKTLQNKS